MSKLPIVERLEEILPLLEELETGQECEEYAFARAKGFQAMTYVPSAFEALRCIPQAATTITELVSALEECQRALATMVEPGAIHKTKVLDAFTTVTKAEARARTALSNTRGDTK